jgi:hypothetical protein
MLLMKSRLFHVILWGIALSGLSVLVAFFRWGHGSTSRDNDQKTEPSEATANQTAPETFFEAKIRPVLDGTCFKCHGGEKVRGGLRVDSRSALLQGGDSGPAVVPGDAEKSLLIEAIRYTHEDIKMPPGKQLPDAVVDNFVAWINNGAVWPERSDAVPLGSRHLPPEKRWAFEPVTKVEPPEDSTGWSANAIDRFVLAKLRKHDLEPAAAADPRTLIRRATFDLIGLPPTPAEVEAFLADHSPNAFENVVDRLLASPQYGERWGRHWLDVVRYADTGGFETDLLYPSAWRYRDYVIRSLNADKPFDRFIREQVAGDELWPDDPDAVMGSGLYCIGPVAPESAQVSNQLEYEWLTDAADTTGAAFLGLTFGCARCHDHKYDPISQKDYYGMQAFFAASDRAFPDKVRLLRIKALNGLLSDAPVPAEKMNDPRCTVKTEEQAGFRLFHREQPLEIRRLHRGELNSPKEVVEPAFPAALPAAAQRPALSEGKRRPALANWLTSPENPLTARVLVNRVWGWHFGQGIVRTPNDFGKQGEPPTHPELLDWLARDFTDHGWSLKHLHRRILLSRTYQMRSVADGLGLRVDADNRLLWHFPRRRLEGEAIRDAMLACAGTLNPKPFGSAVVPPLSQQELTGLFDAKNKWPVTKDVSEHTRRSVYLLVRRTFLYPMFASFDPPEVMTSCPRRAQTVVPTQALALLNSPLAREQAAAFARRLLKECGDDSEKAVAEAWLLAFGRPISPAESERVRAFLKERALAELCLALFNANEFIYID